MDLRLVRPAHLAVLLAALLPASAGAGPVRVDFVGTLSFVGGVAGNDAPPGYDFADASVGDPIFGWFEFDNNLAQWGTVDFDNGVISGATDRTDPLPASFFLQLPLSGKTISPAEAHGQLQARYAARDSAPAVPDFFSLDLGHGPLPSTGGALRSFDFRVQLDNGVPGALDAYIPSVINLDQFGPRSLTFSTQGFTPFITEDFSIAAPISALPVSTGATGSLFEGFGTFEGEDVDGNPLGWDVTGPGIVERVPAGGGGGGNVVRMTTGSPVSLSRLIDTPAEAFELTFLYEFLTTTGMLSVLLGGDTIASIDAPAALGAGLAPFVVLVDDPALLGQSGLELSFLFDGLTGSQILLDDIAATAVVVPVPAALPMFAAAACAGLAGFRRPRRAARWPVNDG